MYDLQGVALALALVQFFPLRWDTQKKKKSKML